MASRMTGVREYRAALKRAPAHLREEVADAIKTTVDGVHARGLANIDAMTTPRSGFLRRYYNKSVGRKSLRGRVGYLSSTSREVVFYARFINDGTIHMPARPFHSNAVEAEQELDTQRMVKARDSVLRRLGGRGSAASLIGAARGFR